MPDLLLVDTDAFRILGGADLLFDLAASLGVPADGIRRLPAVEYQLKKSTRFKKDLPDSAIRNLEQLIAVIPPWTESPKNSQLLDELRLIENIDPGEALLFVTLDEQTAFLLATGDKRSLIALGTAPDHATLRGSIQGRLLALESAIAILIRSIGVQRVFEKLRPLCAANAVVDIVFGHKTEVREDEAIRQLESYLSDLSKKMSCDLLRRIDGVEPTHQT